MPTPRSPVGLAFNGLKLNVSDSDDIRPKDSSKGTCPWGQVASAPAHPPLPSGARAFNGLKLNVSDSDIRPNDSSKGRPKDSSKGTCPWGQVASAPAHPPAPQWGSRV